MLQKIILKPGVNQQLTPTAAEGTWADARFIRFRDGLPENVPGWAKYSQTAIEGTPRGIHSWIELSSTPDLVVGTDKRLYLLRGGSWYDITPIYHTSNPLANNPFATVNLSPTVTVTDAGYHPAVGDFVIFSGATAVAGLTLNNQYTVLTLPSGTTYTINAGSNANATTTGGGAAVAANYLLPIGLANSRTGSGYGSGPYGMGPYGIGSGTGTFVTPARVWALDNWGEDLIASPLNGGIYLWDASSGVTVRAATLTNAPLFNRAVIVGTPQQQVIAGGTEAGGTQDPLLVRWSDTGNNTVWTAASTNAAGSYRISHGAGIIGLLAGQQQIFVWTNEGLDLMQYIGQPLIYSFTQVGHSCGLIAPLARQPAGGAVYWMGDNNFFIFQGTVRVLPCSIWDYVFKNLNQEQKIKCFAGVNSVSNEVLFFFPTANSTEIDAYVKYNWVEDVWVPGVLARTTWEDKEVFDNPLATSPTGYLYAHEIDGAGNDGADITCRALSGYFDIGDGTEYSYVDRLIPDFKNFVGSLNLSVYLLNYPGDTPDIIGPFTVTPTTRFVSFRGRARQAAILIESTSAAATWRLGAMRFNVQPDGRR